MAGALTPTASTDPDDKYVFPEDDLLKPREIHVLLVDDEDVSRKVVKKQLTRCGYQVSVASGGLAAKEMLEKDPAGYSCILSDVRMPGTNGMELLRWVRAREELSRVPVVMISSYENAGTVFECFKQGADDYVLKPVSTKEVLYIWQHVWRRKAEVGVAGSKGQGGTSGGGGASKDGLTDEQLKAHCKQQISRYQKVLELIETEETNGMEIASKKRRLLSAIEEEKESRRSTEAFVEPGNVDGEPSAKVQKVAEQEGGAKQDGEPGHMQQKPSGPSKNAAEHALEQKKAEPLPACA